MAWRITGRSLLKALARILRIWADFIQGIAEKTGLHTGENNLQTEGSPALDGEPDTENCLTPATNPEEFGQGPGKGPPLHWLERVRHNSPPAHWLKLLEEHGVRFEGEESPVPAPCADKSEEVSLSRPLRTGRIRFRFRKPEHLPDDKRRPVMPEAKENKRVQRAAPLYPVQEAKQDHPVPASGDKLVESRKADRELQEDPQGYGLLSHKEDINPLSPSQPDDSGKSVKTPRAKEPEKGNSISINKVTGVINIPPPLRMKPAQEDKAGTSVKRPDTVNKTHIHSTAVHNHDVGETPVQGQERRAVGEAGQASRGEIKREEVRENGGLEYSEKERRRIPLSGDAIYKGGSGQDAVQAETGEVTAADSHRDILNYVDSGQDAVQAETGEGESVPMGPVLRKPEGAAKGEVKAGRRAGQVSRGEIKREEVRENGGLEYSEEERRRIPLSGDAIYKGRPGQDAGHLYIDKEKKLPFLQKRNVFTPPMNLDHLALSGMIAESKGILPDQAKPQHDGSPWPALPDMDLAGDEASEHVVSLEAKQRHWRRMKRLDSEQQGKLWNGSLF